MSNKNSTEQSASVTSSDRYSLATRKTMWNLLNDILRHEDYFNIESKVVETYISGHFHSTTPDSCMLAILTVLRADWDLGTLHDMRINISHCHAYRFSVFHRMICNMANSIIQSRVFMWKTACCSHTGISSHSTNAEPPCLSYLNIISIMDLLPQYTISQHNALNIYDGSCDLRWLTWLYSHRSSFAFVWNGFQVCETCTFFSIFFCLAMQWHTSDSISVPISFLVEISLV